MIDFTNCKTKKKTYAGANGSKICILYHGEAYMLKFPSLPTKKTELSYANSCISEYIACHIYEMLNIPVQETILGTYTSNGKEKIVVACKDFTRPGVVLQDFASLKNQIIDSGHNGSGTELDDVLNAMEMQANMDPELIKERFWDMFVMDALLGNFDRHNGNWGFLYHQETDEVELAPVYDCGSCLYPQADRTVIEKVLNQTHELHARIFNFPTSALKQNGKKIGYHDFLEKTTDMDCIKSLSHLAPQIDLDAIHSFIDSIDCIDDLQKTFYKTMIDQRYELILVPAYNRIKHLGLDDPSSNTKEQEEFER